jgi:hypothetical protein
MLFPKARHAKGVPVEIVSKFLSFDKLMGAALVKIVYFLGLIGICLGVLFGFLGGLGMMGVVGFFPGLMTALLAPVGGIIGICFLRFACELYIVLFRIGDDIAAIRSKDGPIAGSSPPV